MKRFSLLILLTVVNAHAQTLSTADYYFDQDVVRQAYDRLYCQEGRAAIQQRLKSDNILISLLNLAPAQRNQERIKLGWSDYPVKLSDYKLDKYQKCLDGLASGENFDLSPNLRVELIKGLKHKNCSHKLIKVTLQAKLATEWKRQLGSGRPTTEDIRTILVSALERALGEIFCDYNPEDPYPP